MDSNNNNEAANNSSNNNSNNNKSMPQSPVSVASAVSSDTTSETQSVSDEQLTVNTVVGTSRKVNAAKSTRKLSKENTKETTEKEKERPPWRTVITAAPQKVNKNALLKAKILDATRRALLAQKICHIGIQTEPTTTLVREQSIDVQKDLIRKMDKSMDTDGVITIRRECPQGFIITHTVGQMTETSLGLEMGTQTSLPSATLNFSMLRAVNSSGGPNAEDTFDAQLKQNEIILRSQMDALRQLDAGTLSHSPDDANEPYDSLDSAHLGSNSQNNNFAGHTLTCWDDFDVSDDGNALPDLPRKTVSDGSTPWNNFTDQIIGRRMGSMHLSPVPRRAPTKNSKGKSVTWNEKQLAVTRLLTETSALVDIFDEMAMRLGPNVELKHPTVPHIEPIVIPESKWNERLADSCNALEEKLTDFNSRERKS